MLPCVLVPDLAGFDWPAARLPENGETKTEHEHEIPEGGPPAELFSNWTMRGAWRLSSVAVVSIPSNDGVGFSAPCRSARFDWPAGGTEEFLGRWAARLDRRRTEAKGALADPPNVFGAADRFGGNRNDRTSRCRREEVPLVARVTDPKLQRVKSGIPGCAP